MNKSKPLKMFLIIMGIVAIIFIILFLNHKIKIGQELKYLKKYDIGEIIEINNKKVNYKIFNEEIKEKTIILMGGSGVTDLSLSFKPLADKINAKIILINRPGYGGSSDTNNNAEIDYIINFYREVLKKLNVTSKVILMPHSIGGMYAMYWGEMYPEEIDGIIGLDIGSPYLYIDNYSSKFSNTVSYIGSKFGLHRFIYKIGDSNCAVKNYGIYDNDYFKAIWYMNMINPYSKFNLSEENLIKENASKVIKNINYNYHSIRKLYIMANSISGNFYEEYEKENLEDYYKNEEDIKKYIENVKTNQEKERNSLMLDSNTSFAYVEGPHMLYYYPTEELVDTINNFIDSI